MIHLIHAPVDLRELGRWSAERGMIREDQLDEGAVLHHLLSEMFGKGALQPFRLFTRKGRPTGGLYGYAGQGAEELCETARLVAAPNDLAVIDLSRLRSKEMPERLRKGQRLGFDVRVRPVARHEVEERRVESDVFDRRRALARERGEERPAGDRREVYARWLSERLKGARVETGRCRLAAYRRSRPMRGGKLREAGPDAVLQGEMEIVDPDGFATSTARGIGRHKAFGYGMVLLRPVAQE